MNLPHLPDMVFSKNGLSIIHEKGYGLRFDPIDALKTVNAHEDLVHVAMSKEWLEARSDHADINKIAKRYDWTFTPTNYKGTILKYWKLAMNDTKHKTSISKIFPILRLAKHGEF